MHFLPVCLLLMTMTLSRSTAAALLEKWRFEPATAADFSPDETIVAVGDSKGKILLLNAGDGSPITSWTGSNPIWRIEFSPSGAHFLVVANYTVALYRLADHRLLGSVRTQTQIPAATFSPDGHFLTIADRSVIFSRRVPEFTEAPGPITAAGHVNTLRYSPDGTRLASGTGIRNIGVALQLWDPATGSLVWSNRTSQTYGIGGIDFSPDGAVLASANKQLNFEGKLEFWNTQTGALLDSLDRRVYDVAYSPQAPVIATIDLNLRLYTLPRGLLAEQTAVGVNYTATRVRFNKSGTRLLVASPHVVVFEIPRVITHLERTGPNLTLRWISPGHTTSVETSTDLHNAWSPLDTPPSAQSVTIPIEPGTRFFRLKN